MNKLLLLLFVANLSNQVSAQENRREIESSIGSFFNGLSLFNEDTLKLYSTSDFHLLEDGHVWNMDTLLAKVMPRKNSKIQRINSFEFIKSEQNDNTAWVSYYNSAEFRLGERQQVVKWLESVVMKKINGIWKIQMMHSTKLK